MTLLRRSSLGLSLALALAAAPAYAADEAGLSAQAEATAKILAVPGDHAGEAYALVESLTTEIGPRLAGSPNFERAMDWAKARFKALGYDRVYAEPVQFKTWERRHESGEVLGPFPQKLALTALGGTVGTNGPIEGGGGRVRQHRCAEGGAGGIAGGQDRLRRQSHGALQGRPRLQSGGEGAQRRLEPPPRAPSPTCSARSAPTAIAFRIPATRAIPKAAAASRPRPCRTRMPTSFRACSRAACR
jgi:hypothetical protein